MIAAYRCGSLGSCINLLTSLTAYAMSGLAMVKYIRLPTSWRNLVGSLTRSPTSLFHCPFLYIGKSAGLHPNSPNLVIRSMAYLHWDRHMPFFDLATRPRTRCLLLSLRYPSSCDTVDNAELFLTFISRIHSSLQARFPRKTEDHPTLWCQRFDLGALVVHLWNGGNLQWPLTINI